MAETFTQRLGRWFGRRPKQAGAKRLYSGARNSRLTVGFGGSGDSSSDAELYTSLRSLRSRSRQMIRDSAYAKRAKTIVVNNVIGAGIGLQAQVMSERSELRTRVNDAIEEAWREWCDAQNCHTGGAVHFSDMERLLMGQVFETGEIFVRMHFDRLGDSVVPLTLEIVEPERIADDHQIPAELAPGARVRMGIEVNALGRPIAYWIRKGHPGDLREQPEADRFERVPAEQVFHLRIVDRWPQTRGEPWLHAVLRKLDDMNEYSASEIQAARAASYYFGTITSPAPDNPLIDTSSTDTSPPSMNIEPLAIQQLAPGEQLEFHQPTRPNAALDPFMRYMLREVAAGAGPSYESLSRDYSQSNYSSSRLALLDDRDLWRTLQAWWIRSFRKPLHKVWLRQAVMSRAVGPIGIEEYALAMRKFEAVLFKPRGWSWVDPTKEVAAYKEAVKAGFTTVTDVIAQTAGGLDIEDVLATRERELEMMEEHGLKFDTDPVTEDSTPPPAPSPPTDSPPEQDDEEQTTRPQRVVSFGR